MRDCDLIPAFLDVLEELDASAAKTLEAEADFAPLFDSEDDWETVCDEHQEAASYLTEALFEALGALAPSYFYFGSHPGDGADYGFWFDEESMQDAVRCGEVLGVADTSEVPEDYTGEVYHVNDHGNATLYAAQNGHLAEIWAIA